MAYITVTDQMGESVTLQFPPQRIISLVPSQTELLSYFQLGSQVAGITKFCIRPKEWFKSKPHIGGTKNFNFDLIDKIQPDLIIGNKEENYEEGITNLKKRYPVWMSDIFKLEDAFQMMESVGLITGSEARSKALIRSVKLSFSNFKKRRSSSVLYLIWKNPWMAAGKETFIDDMLQHAGLINAVDDKRYPILNDEKMSQLKADYVFLSSEPYPFKPGHLGEIKSIMPSSKPILVDGEIFSWYGSRLLHAPEYFARLPL